MEEKKVEKSKTTEVPIDNLMKGKLADMVMNLGKARGMNTQELVAIKSALKKNKLDINEMMGMLMMKKMMGDDGGKKMNPMEMMMMMQMMNSDKGKDTEWQKKFEELQREMREKDKINILRDEIKKIADKKGDGFGIKEMMAMWAERDRTSEKWRSENDKLKNEIIMKEVSGAIGGLSEQFKKLRDGSGDIERIGKTVESIRKMNEQFGFNKKQERGKGELAKELVENVTKSLAPAINKGMEVMSSNVGSKGITPDQAQRLQQIQSQRQPEQPPQAAPVEPKKNYYIDDSGHKVYPSLLNLSSDKKKGD